MRRDEQLQFNFLPDYPPKEELLNYIVGAFKKYEIPFTLNVDVSEIEITMLNDCFPRYASGTPSVRLTADFGGIDNELQGN